MMGGFGFGAGMFGIGALIMIAFWVLVIGGAVWLVVTLARNNQGAAATASGQTPLAILQARYAKGEITKEQFDEMKRTLGA
jgi:putative membrane protein